MVTGSGTLPEVVLPDDALADRPTFEGWCSERKNVAGLSVTPPGEPLRPPSQSVLLFGKWWLPLIPDDESICPHLARDGFWEAWTSLAFARAVRPGARVVDLGGHVGWFTLLALARGAERVFYAEPQPEAARCLIRCLRDADLLWRVDRYGGAVADKWTIGELFTYGDLTGSAGLRPAEGWEPEGQIRTGVAPLDGLLALDPEWKGRPVDVVKVDVEGAEVDVWEGMRKTLARSPVAVVMMEVAARRGYDVPAFLRRIAADGWRVRRVDEDGNIAELPRDPAPLFDPARVQAWETLWLEASGRSRC